VATNKPEHQDAPCDGCVHAGPEDDTYALIGEASNAIAVGDYEAARDAYLRAIAAGERRGEGTGGTKLSLIDLLDRMGDDEGVLALADDLDAAGVPSAAMNIARASAYLRMERHAEAVEAGRAAIADLERDGGFVTGVAGLLPSEAWYRYALALRFGGDPAASIEPFSRAIELAPLHARSHFDLAIALCATGDRRAAVRSLERAIELDPGDNDAHYNLACYRALLGDRDGALASLARAIELEPDNAILARDDADLATVRDDAAFAKLVS
jgi:tetratricopeptide (TPR) repeat protein